MPIRRNYSNIYQDTKGRILRNTPVNNFNNTGLTKALVDSQSIEMEKFYDQLEYIYTAIDPTVSVGSDLDKIGFLVGESRTGSVTAADYTSTNFYFYIDRRLQWGVRQLIERYYSYDEILLLVDAGYVVMRDDLVITLTIPAGTLVKNSNGSITYTTIEDLVLTGMDNGYVGIVATGAGPDFNVETNALIAHSLLQVPELRKIAPFIKCTNTFPIQNGRYSQTDDEYRYTISTSRAAIRTNELAIRRAALSVPGIRDIAFEKSKFGNGTISMIIDGISPIISEGLKETVRQRIQTELSYGDIIFINSPEYLGVELSFYLTLLPGEENPELVRNQVKDAIIQYINDLPIGGEIIWNRIVNLALEISGVEDFIPSIFKYGEYDSMNKLNKNQKVLRFINQKADYNQKWYSDNGLVNCCV